MSCRTILLGLFLAAFSFSQTPDISQLKQRAEAGNAAAQDSLGLIYDHAQGVPQDYAEAVKWYRKAAEQGDAGGQYDLGVMYYNGNGIQQDYAEAVRWFRKAADQGHSAAQNNLGWVYEHGQGVPRDAAQAVAWYRKAAEQGISIARENLERMARIGQAPPQACPVVMRVESSNSPKAGLLAGLTGAGASNTYLIIRYKNNSEKPVAGVRFVVVYVNSVREPIDTEDITTPSQKLKPGKSFSLVRADGYITGGNKVETLGWVAKVQFSDGSSWSDDGSKACSSIVQ